MRVFYHSNGKSNDQQPPFPLYTYACYSFPMLSPQHGLLASFAGLGFLVMCPAVMMTAGRYSPPSKAVPSLSLASAKLHGISILKPLLWLHPRGLLAFLKTCFFVKI